MNRTGTVWELEENALSVKTVTIIEGLLLVMYFTLCCVSQKHILREGFEGKQLIWERF
jgi:hypothetical protein